MSVLHSSALKIMQQIFCIWVLSSLFGLVNVYVNSSSSNKSCSNDNCDRGTMTVDFDSKDSFLLSFKTDQDIFIVNRVVSHPVEEKVGEIWEVEINGIRGYVPKKYVLENLSDEAEFDPLQHPEYEAGVSGIVNPSVSTVDQPYAKSTSAVGINFSIEDMDINRISSTYETPDIPAVISTPVLDHEAKDIVDMGLSLLNSSLVASSLQTVIDGTTIEQDYIGDDHNDVQATQYSESSHQLPITSGKDHGRDEMKETVNTKLLSSDVTFSQDFKVTSTLGASLMKNLITDEFEEVGNVFQVDVLNTEEIESSRVDGPLSSRTLVDSGFINQSMNTNNVLTKNTEENINKDNDETFNEPVLNSLLVSSEDMNKENLAFDSTGVYDTQNDKPVTENDASYDLENYKLNNGAENDNNKAEKGVKLDTSITNVHEGKAYSKPEENKQNVLEDVNMLDAEKGQAYLAKDIEDKNDDKYDLDYQNATEVLDEINSKSQKILNETTRILNNKHKAKIDIKADLSNQNSKENYKKDNTDVKNSVKETNNLEILTENGLTTHKYNAGIDTNSNLESATKHSEKIISLTYGPIDDTSTSFVLEAIGKDENMGTNDEDSEEEEYEEEDDMFIKEKRKKLVKYLVSSNTMCEVMGNLDSYIQVVIGWCPLYQDQLYIINMDHGRKDGNEVFQVEDQSTNSFEFVVAINRFIETLLEQLPEWLHIWLHQQTSQYGLRPKVILCLIITSICIIVMHSLRLAAEALSRELMFRSKMSALDKQLFSVKHELSLARREINVAVSENSTSITETPVHVMQEHEELKSKNNALSEQVRLVVIERDAANEENIRINALLEQTRSDLIEAEALVQECLDEKRDAKTADASADGNDLNDNNNMSDLVASINSLQHQLGTQKEALTKYEGKIRRREVELKERIQEVRRLRADFANAKLQRDKALSERDELEVRIQSDVSRFNSLNEDIVQFRTALEEVPLLKQKLGTSLDDLQALKVKLDSKCYEIQVLEETIQTLQVAKKAQEVKSSASEGWDCEDVDEDDLKDAFDDTEGDILEAIREGSQLRVDLRNAKNDCQILEQQIKEADETQQLLKQQLAAQQLDLEAARKCVEAAVEENRALEQKHSILAEYFNNRETKLQNMLCQTTAQLGDVEQSSESSLKRIEALSEEVNSYRLQVNSLKLEMAEQENSLKAKNANLEHKQHESWVTIRQESRRNAEVQSEMQTLRSRLTVAEAKLTEKQVDLCRLQEENKCLLESVHNMASISSLPKSTFIHPTKTGEEATGYSNGNATLDSLDEDEPLPELPLLPTGFLPPDLARPMPLGRQSPPSLRRSYSRSPSPSSYYRRRSSYEDGASEVGHGYSDSHFERRGRRHRDDLSPSRYSLYSEYSDGCSRSEGVGSDNNFVEDRRRRRRRYVSRHHSEDDDEIYRDQTRRYRYEDERPRRRDVRPRLLTGGSGSEGESGGPKTSSPVI